MLKRLAALAGVVGTAVVRPRPTGTWQATRSGVAWLLGRGEPARQAVIGAQLEDSDAALVVMASAGNGRMASGHVMRGLGRFVPGWRVCTGLLVLALDGVSAGVLVDAVEGAGTLDGAVEEFPAALADRGSLLLAGQVPSDDGPVAVLDARAVLRLREELPRARRSG